jgi:hypothetical protein
MTSPSERDPDIMLRTELVRQLPPSREQRIRELLMLKMGNHKPSQFLRHLRSLTPDIPDDFLHSIWSCRLPVNIRAILASQLEDDLDTAARRADRIFEVTSQQALMSVVPLSDSNTLLKRFDDLSRQVAALSAEWAHLRSSSRNCCPSSRSSSRDDAATTLCWYHRRYGAKAQKCTQPCAYHQQGS